MRHRKMRRQMLAVLICSVLLFSGCGLLFPDSTLAPVQTGPTLPVKSEEEPTDAPSSETEPETPAPTEPTETPAETPSETPTETPVEPTETEAPTEPPKPFSIDAFYFQKLIEDAGYTPEDITGSQLVIVRAMSSEETRIGAVYFFEKDEEGEWHQADVAQAYSENMLAWELGYLGRDGTGPDANDSIARTPVGLFDLGPCFGAFELTGLKMDYFKITEHHHWAGGINKSKYFNQPVIVTEDGTYPKYEYDTYECTVITPDMVDWGTEEEDLIHYLPNYDYAVFFNYNGGYAYFVHIKDTNTGGCVGLPRKTMIRLFDWLDKEKDPQILLYIH